ncbi:MAG TPA: dihydrofolate reductase family protein [Gemmatimonadaceae bacterium]|jgi:dihydrofolate reductase|nr:dihydrofolate reductase family protein [Gemmatimonadaceae bacterium]
MRTVTYGAACSLDGFITGPDENIDWLHHSADANDIMRRYWKAVDTIIMGRKTYDFSLTLGGAPPMPGIKATYVFSRTRRTLETPGMELVSSDPADFVRNLKARPGKGICLLGGGELAQPLIAAGLVDEIGLNVHPILLGSGTPLFRDAGHLVRLELTENRTIDGGCVFVNYRVQLK